MVQTVKYTVFIFTLRNSFISHRMVIFFKFWSHHRLFILKSSTCIKINKLYTLRRNKVITYLGKLKLSSIRIFIQACAKTCTKIECLDHNQTCYIISQISQTCLVKSKVINFVTNLQQQSNTRDFVHCLPKGNFFSLKVTITGPPFSLFFLFCSHFRFLSAEKFHFLSLFSSVYMFYRRNKTGLQTVSRIAQELVIN